MGSDINGQTPDDLDWLAALAGNKPGSGQEAQLRRVMREVELADAAQEDTEHDWQRLQFALRREPPRASRATSRNAWSGKYYFALAASVVLTVVTFLLVRTPPDTQPVVVARQGEPAATPEAAAPPPRIRLAEVEPAQRAAESTGGEAETLTSNLRRESEPVTAQASSGFPNQSDEETPKEFPNAKPPKAWLEEIRALHRQGDLVAAKEQLRQFRKKYPDYPLPEEFKTLVK